MSEDKKPEKSFEELPVAEQIDILRDEFNHVYGRIGGLEKVVQALVTGIGVTQSLFKRLVVEQAEQEKKDAGTTIH